MTKQDMKCPKCKKSVSHEDAVKTKTHHATEYVNEWSEKACPFCGVDIVFTVGIVPKHPGRWEFKYNNA